MKKTLILMAFIWASAAWAEPTAASDHSQNYLGFQFGYANSSVSADYDNSGNDDIGYKSGLELGVQLEVPLFSWFSIQPEIRYVQKGFTYLTNAGDTNSIRINYIEIPVLAKFVLPIGSVVFPFAYAGPFVALKVGESGTISQSGDYADAGNPQDNDLYFTQDQINTFQAGLQFGIGVDFQINNSLKAFFAFERDAGLTDLGPGALPPTSPGANIFLVGMSFGLTDLFK